ncbi:MAG TPA: NADH-quinone oxidoreductase subunit H [Armatimonadota bacterium]|nr:NADH-quinone oxidoreductase subunit H [Armatimonadota bacterium]
MKLLLQIAAVLYVLLVAPFIAGCIARWEARLQSKRGPSIWQPYYDLMKLFRKEQVITPDASWIFRFCPYLGFVAPIAVATLIPVYTGYPLYMAFAGDMLAGGFILGLGGFFFSLAALDTGSPYAALSSSRARVVSLMVEPTLFLIIFGVSLVAGSTIPFIVNQALTGPTELFTPTHFLLAIALFMVILAETGRIPIDTHSGREELLMVEGGRSFEYSGAALALLHWGGWMKQMVLMLILMNVIVGPWGLAADTGPWHLLCALFWVLVKLLLVALIVALVEQSYAKMRFFRIPEYMGAAFVLTLLAVIFQLLR